MDKVIFDTHFELPFLVLSITDKVFQSLPSIDGTCIDLERAKEQQEALVKVSDI